MLNFTPMVLLPPLLQQYAGYPDRIIGEIIAARGVGATIGFFLAIFVGKLDPRIGLIGGFGLQAASGLWLMSLDLNVDTATLLANSLVQGIAIGVIWVPLTLATFATIEARHLAEGTAVYHLLRNIGSSFFISLCVAEIVRATGANYGRMVEMITPYNHMLTLPSVMGAWNMDTVEGLARIAREINRQAAMIGYLNAFGMYTLASALAIPAILFVAGRARARNV
jgi:DHA2 family multidrug resistance protein